MQLHNLLTSIERNCHNVFDQITVLYNTTSAEFEEGYKLLYKNFPHIKLVKETNFKSNVLNLLKSSRHEYTCLLVDDAIFYRLVPKDAKNNIMDAFKLGVTSFILGVGENTRWSMTANIAFEFPKIFEKYNDMYIYNWKQGVRKKSEFECPFMLVGNIYKTSTLYKYSKDLEFKQPNSYEIKLQMFVQQFYRDELSDECACFKNSVVLHSPNNCVQREWSSYASVSNPVELNRLYLNGYTIDYDGLEFKNVNGLHMNIELKLIK
jgi:hypothetical protein